LRQLLKILFLATCVLIVACDPGMTIRQVKPTLETYSKSNLAVAQVIVAVQTTRPMTGVTWYAPGLKVTNSLQSPITVINAELATTSELYTNKPLTPGTFPLAIAPGSTETLGVWFDLKDDVWNTFRQTAELRVHYRNGSNEEIARANVIGGRLDDTP
jgi:hypothetical protein